MLRFDLKALQWLWNVCFVAANGSDVVSDSLTALFCDKCALALWSSDELGESLSEYYINGLCLVLQKL